MYYHDDRVTCVTGTALNMFGREVCRTGTSAADVKKAFGPADSQYKWESDTENVWVYTYRWGSVEVHMNASNSKVFHSRLTEVGY